jgi:hypothetical protein
LQLGNIAAAYHSIVRPQRRDEPFYNVGDVTLRPMP